MMKISKFNSKALHYLSEGILNNGNTKDLLSANARNSSYMGISGGVTSILAAGSLFNGLRQALQEFLLQLVPRAGFGWFVRNSWKMAADETILELTNYLLAYLMPTLVATSLAMPVAKIFGIPHFELLGQRMYKLEQNKDQTILFGTSKPKQVKLTGDLISKLGGAKLLLFAMTAIYSIGAQLMEPSVRVLLVKKLLGTDDFYEISGLTEADSGKANLAGQAAIERAWANIRRGLALILCGIPALLGLAMAVRGSKFHHPSIAAASRIFTLDNRFGLSKTLIGISLLVALYSYTSVARNAAERREILTRLVYFSVPTVLFFKQLVGNLSVMLVGLASGVGNLLSSPKVYFRELSIGKRDVFDLDLVGLSRSSQGTYEGSILNNLKLKSLAAKDPVAYRRLLGRLMWANNWTPYVTALFTGFGISWLNYMRTAKTYADSQKDQLTSKSSTSNLRVALEGITGGKPRSP